MLLGVQGILQFCESSRIAGPWKNKKLCVGRVGKSNLIHELWQSKLSMQAVRTLPGKQMAR